MLKAAGSINLLGRNLMGRGRIARKNNPHPNPLPEYMERE
jgi:hypothetical protein